MVDRIRYTEEFKIGTLTQVTDRGHIGYRANRRQYQVALRLSETLWRRAQQSWWTIWSDWDRTAHSVNV